MANFPTYGTGQSGTSNGGVQFPTYGAQADQLSTSEGLYSLAQQQGGAVSQAATEIMHPTTGLLSSIGNGLKNAFHGFIDTISTPSEIIAGMISPDKSISEAIQQHITPSDVIFGDKDPNASIYQKVGSFLVRTATDVLLDPLTYLTFGVGEGFMGLRAGTKISLQEGAAAQMGKEALSTGTLNKSGQEVYSYLSSLSRQMTGSTSAEIAKTGNQLLDLSGDELKSVMRATIDSPLSPDFAKKAISNLMEHNPAYTMELLDKGGIKVFGKTILSGQRIATTLQMIPGMTLLDHMTQQPRLAIQALFNPAVVKGLDGNYTRLPLEYVEMHQRWADYAKAMGEGKIGQLDNIVKQFDLNSTEARYLTAAIENKRIPTDPRLAQAYKATLGFNDNEWKQLVDAGLLSTQARLEGHVPHILVKNDVGSVAFRMPPSTATGATKLRQIATFTDIAKGSKITGHAGSMGLNLVKEGEHAGLFTNSVGDVFRREVAPIHEATDNALAELEGTLLKSPQNAAKMLDQMRAAGLQGFDDNAVTALAARSLKNTKAISMKYFLRDLAENFGHDAQLAGGSGYTRISSTGLKDAADEVMPFWSKDGELMYHPAIAAHVEKFMGSLLNDDATMDFLKQYDNLQNVWKATVTSIWPAFHGRNAISNVLQNFLDLGVHALNPHINTMSIQMMNADRQIANLSRTALAAGEEGLKAQGDMNNLLMKVLFTDKTGHEWTYGELRQVIKNNQIAFTRASKVTSSDVASSAEKSAKSFFGNESLFGKAKAVVGKPFKIGQDVVGGSIEDHARLTNFIANLRNTGDVTMAAQRTKQFLFDYSNLTNFEKTFMKRLVPFYTFTRKNLELQVRSLITTPGRIAAEAHAINTLGEVISGGNQLSDEDYKALPDWVKTGIGILTKKNGDQVTMISNFGTPLEQPFQQLQANVLLGSVSPLVRLPVEQLAGYSFFEGKPLSEVTNAAAFVHAPKFIQDMIGYTALNGTKSNGQKFTWYVSLHPEMMNLLLNLPPTTRVYSALKQMEAADVDTQAKIFQQITGVKPYSFDLARERQKREDEMVTKLQNILTKAGVTAQFSRTYIPKVKKTFNPNQ